MGAQRRDLLAVPGLACEQNTPPHADGLAQPCVLAPVRRVASAIGSFAFLPGTTHALMACVLNVDFAADGVHWRGSFARRTAPSGFPRNSRTRTSGCAICARQGDWDASRGVAETVDSARVAVPLRARPAPGARRAVDQSVDQTYGVTGCETQTRARRVPPFLTRVTLCYPSNVSGRRNRNEAFRGRGATGDGPSARRGPGFHAPRAATRKRVERGGTKAVEGRKCGESVRCA